MAKKPIKKHPAITNDHHKAIAKVVIEVARMEWLLQALFQTMMHRRGKSGRAIVANVKQYDAFSKVAKSVLHEMIPAQGAKIDSFFAEMNDVREERHKIVHWQWGKQGKRVYLTKLSAYTAKFNLEYRTALQIDAIAERAAVACTNLILWQNEVHEVLFPNVASQPAWRGKKIRKTPVLDLIKSVRFRPRSLM
jgi:hypothetical protein